MDAAVRRGSFWNGRGKPSLSTLTLSPRQCGIHGCRQADGETGSWESAAAFAPFRQCDRQGSPLLSCPSVRQRSRGSPRVMVGGHAHRCLPSMACDGHGLEWHVVSQALGTLGRASGGGLVMKQGENQA